MPAVRTTRAPSPPVPQAWLRTLLATSGAPAAILEPGGHIAWASPGLRRLWPAIPGDPVGWNLLTAFESGPDRAAFSGAIAAVAGDGVAREAVTAVVFDGVRTTLAWSLARCEPADGDRTAVVAVATPTEAVPEPGAAGPAMSAADLERELRARTAELDEARRLAGLGFFRRNVVTGTVAWSPELYAMFGMDDACPLPTADEFDALCTPESVVRRKAAVELATITREPWDVELEIRRPSGERRTLLQRGVVEHDPEGRVVGYHGTVLDVTAQRGIERDLHDLWSSTTTALDSTPDSVGLYRVVRDGGGRFTDAVPLFINRVGRRRWFHDLPDVELRGEGMFGRFPELRPLIFDLYARVADSGVAFHGPRAFRTPDGDRIIDLSITPFDGGIVHVGRDVTEERSAHDALRASEDKLRRMVEGIDAVVSYKEPGDGPVTLSPQVERLLGYRPEDVAPYESWEAIVHPDDLARCRAAWQAPEDAWDIEYRVRHADGAWVWIADHGRRIRDGHGVGSFGVVTDVSRGRAADERFRAVFEENPEAIGVVRPVRDEAGRFANAEFVAANRAARDLFLGGVGPDHVGSFRLFGISPEVDAVLFEPSAAACDRGDQFRGEVRRRAAGGDRWLDVSLFPFDGGLAFVARDITAERTAAAALRESEARFRAVTDSAADAIVTVDVEGTIVAVNPSVCRMYDAAEADLVGKPVTMLMPGRFTVGHDVAIRDFGLGEGHPPTATPVALYGRRLDGTEFPVELSLSSWTHEGERFTTAFIRDVTERRRAEEAARTADARVQRFFEANLFGIQIAEPDGRVVDANDYWLSLTGWTRDDLERGEANWRTVTAPESIAADDRAIAEIHAAGSSTPFEKEYVRRDGTRVPALVVRMTMPGDGDRIASFVLDMTATREATRGLARLAAAIEQTTESVVITDTDAHIQYVNPAFERASGYTASEAIGQNPRILRSGVHSRAFYDSMWATLAAGETWNGELINRRKDGTHYTEVASISPIRDTTGTTTAYVAVKRDVTAERELEAQARQGQRLDILGQLAGGVAHDFNNLLAAIRGYGEFVEATLPEGGQARADLDEMLRATDHATGLTRQLLVFSRRQAVSPQQVRPAEVIGEVVKMLRRLLGEHIELVTRLEPAAGPVLADPGALEQVVMNLVLNARDAMPDGGRVEIACERVAGSGASPASARISVADTGCGMPPETLARIYEPFFTTKEPGKGTGLGLATVYGIVQASGGQIRVTSTVGEGTTFVVDLPLVGPESAAASTGRTQPHGGTETILVVEDEVVLRAMIRRMLVGLGYRVLDAPTGQEALGLLRDRRGDVDLLLTDVRMPGIQGPELARQTLAIAPGLRVLFMSAFAEDLGSQARGLGPIRLLDKPFGADALARAVRDALDATPGASPA